MGLYPVTRVVMCPVEKIRFLNVTFLMANGAKRFGNISGMAVFGPSTSMRRT